MKKWLFLIISCISLTLNAHEAHYAGANNNLAVSFAADQNGILWRVSIQNGFVQVAKSQDLKTFSPPVKVNQEAQDISPMGEVRPKIAIGTHSEIYVAWMQNLKPRFSGYIWFARSLNGGKGFEKPYILHQDRDEIGHAFEAIQVAQNGNITVVWLDSRDLVSAKKAGNTHIGSSIYYATSSNSGESFSREQKLADNTCECCRIVTTSRPDSTVVALWRHIFDENERDHMIAEIPKDSGQAPILKRASYGRWKVDGCPHHGAAITVGGEGKNWWGYHLAYFDGNNKKPGLYYSRVDGEAWAFSPPKKFGRHEYQAGHPALFSHGENVWLAWRENDEKSTYIRAMFSNDGGRNWQEPTTVASTEEKADYPQLISINQQAYLIWNTLKDGLRIMPLKEPSLTIN